MRSLGVAILVVCLSLSLVISCDSGDKEESALDTTAPAESEPGSATRDSSRDENGEDQLRNPVRYLPSPTEIVAVLMETEPWWGVIGSETPSVVVYADGTVVYLAKLPDRAEWTYLEFTLTEPQLADLRKELGPSKAFTALEGFIDLAPDTTDQSRTKIYLSDGIHTKAVSVRTYFSPAERAEIGQRLPDVTWPEYERLAEFDRVYDTLTALHSDDVREWEPWYVEVYVYGSRSLDDWRRDNQSHEGFGSDKPYVDPKPWPDNWPTFINFLTWDWGDDSYSFYLPGSSLDEVRRFFASPSTDGGVLIESHVYHAMFRYAFPGEGTYADAFDEAEKDDNPGRLGL